MTAPPAEIRDQLFKTFGRAWFKRDIALLYEAVTPDFVWRSSDAFGNVREIGSRPAIAEAFAEMASKPATVRFVDVVYHHAPEDTFMTFRLVETDAATGLVREEDGVERYSFRDGRIAIKDVYRKPVQPAISAPRRA